MKGRRDSPGERDKIDEDDVSMNEELRKWLAESGEEIKIPKEEKKTSKKDMKKPVGKCQICGEKNAQFVCLKCERPICRSCYFKIIGVCTKCIPKDIVERWMEKHPDWEKVLGVEWVD